MKFETTLSALRKAGACYSGYNKLVRALQGREFTAEDEARETYIRFAHKAEIPLLYILESNGLDDALWSLRGVEGAERDARMFAVWCARQVEHLMTDQRSKTALDVAERHANGCATDDELVAARDAAQDAARDDLSTSAAWYARAAAWYAALAAWSAAKAAAMATARDAAWDARAAMDAASAAQREMFIKMCNGTAPWQGETK